MHKALAFAALAPLALAACDTSSSGNVDTSDSGEGSVVQDSTLAGFEGARAGQAEMGIQNLGYELTRSEGLTSYWFNRSNGACARITTSDGRYSDITMLPFGDC